MFHLSMNLDNTWYANILMLDKMKNILFIIYQTGRGYEGGTGEVGVEGSGGPNFQY